MGDSGATLPARRCQRSCSEGNKFCLDWGGPEERQQKCAAQNISFFLIVSSQHRKITEGLPRKPRGLRLEFQTPKISKVAYSTSRSTFRRLELSGVLTEIAEYIQLTKTNL